MTEFLHFPLLNFKDVCTTEKEISCILLDDDYFLQGLPLSWHVQQLPGGSVQSVYMLENRLVWS